MKKLLTITLLFSLSCVAQDSTKHQQQTQPQQQQPQPQEQKQKYYYVFMTDQDWQNAINGLSHCKLTSDISTPIVEVINEQVLYQMRIEKQRADSIAKIKK